MQRECTLMGIEISKSVVSLDRADIMCLRLEVLWFVRVGCTWVPDIPIPWLSPRVSRSYVGMSIFCSIVGG